VDKEAGTGSGRGGRSISVAGSEAYIDFLDELKGRIRQARIRVNVSVNRQLLELYWNLGREIVLRQEAEGWGSSVIERLSSDLRRSFPGMRGLSVSNIWRMRAFFLAHRAAEEKLAQPVRDFTGTKLPEEVPDLPWSHQVVLIEKTKVLEERAWYASMASANGWSRNVLAHQIESDLFQRQGRAITNFDRALPEAQSELAQELLKDPYHLDFLDVGGDVRERDLERSLLLHLKDFLLELGVGFALVGDQFSMEVGGQEYRIDLLFYHLRLRCFVAVELKVGSFQPEHAGKMSFYLSALDDQVRQKGDRPSIGLILCKDRNQVIVEYALRGSTRPIGVAAYRLTKRLPQNYRGSLPSPEELRKGLGGSA